MTVGRQLRKELNINSARIISICLEPQPEVAAVKGLRALMVTSGATPLEGIPGHTTCGQIDPSIVLTLSESAGWGPEKINTELTKQSGLLGSGDLYADLRNRGLPLRARHLVDRTWRRHLRTLLGFPLCVDRRHGGSQCRLLHRKDPG